MRPKRNDSLLYPKKHHNNSSLYKGHSKSAGGPLYSAIGGSTIAGSVDSVSVSSSSTGNTSLSSNDTTVVHSNKVVIRKGIRRKNQGRGEKKESRQSPSSSNRDASEGNGGWSSWFRTSDTATTNTGKKDGERGHRVSTSRRPPRDIVLQSPIEQGALLTFNEITMPPPIPFPPSKKKSLPVIPQVSQSEDEDDSNYHEMEGKYEEENYEEKKQERKSISLNEHVGNEDNEDAIIDLSNVEIADSTCETDDECYSPKSDGGSEKIDDNREDVEEMLIRVTLRKPLGIVFEPQSFSFPSNSLDIRPSYSVSSMELPSDASSASFFSQRGHGYIDKDISESYSQDDESIIPLGACVYSLLENSNADRLKKLQKGDELLSVNDITTCASNQVIFDDAIDMIKRIGDDEDIVMLFMRHPVERDSRDD